MKPIPLILASTAAILLSSCSTPPKSVTPVTGFDSNRYLGTWFEIARLDHPFERGLSNVTATYKESSNPSGPPLTVLNRGYKDKEAKWQEIKGSARFLGDPSTGSLEVKVGAPFYGGYHIIALDESSYQHALVCGPSLNYLWILARTPSLDPATLEKLITTAEAAGFNTANLITVRHDNPPPTNKPM